MLLDVMNLTKIIKNNTILNDISFSVYQNEIVSIIGHSGAGKTTLIRCLNNLTTFESGQILIEDLLIKPNSIVPNIHDKIGIVFQNFNLFPHLTVLENLTISLLLKNKSNKSEIIKQAFEWLNTLRIEDKANQFPFQLSGGEKQRVAIARACMLNPKILCFDEPTSALDPGLTEEVAKVIKQLKNKNITVLIITHDMYFARIVSNRIIEMEKGLIISQKGIY